MTHDQDTTPVSIYALCDPDTGEVKYIGQTCDPSGRLRGHISGARYGSRTHAAWIEALRARGRVPLLRVLEVVPAHCADDVERSQIAAHRARGCQLTNGVHNFEQNPRHPGRRAGPPVCKATVLLPRELIDWAKHEPEGMSALSRRLLEQERADRRTDGGA